MTTACLKAYGDKIPFDIGRFTPLYMTNVTQIYDICTTLQKIACVILGLPGSVLPAFIPVATSLGA